MSNLRFNFEFQKSLQASALIMRLHGGSVGIMRLLKILYIADRELLAETGSTLTGDQAFAMKNGPVLSAMYDLTKMRSSHSAVWDDLIDKIGIYLRLRSDPGREKLSVGEVDKIQRVCKKYEDLDDVELSELTHSFAEWANVFDQSNPGSSYRMSWEDALRAQGKADLIDAVRLELEEKRRIDAAFGDPP